METWRLTPDEQVRCLECRALYVPQNSATGCPQCGCVSWITVRTRSDSERTWVDQQHQAHRRARSA